MAKDESDKTFIGTLGGMVLTSLPVVSAVVFFAVAIKVFRVANMETATTVAVVSQADVVALLKGVVLTLLPGFLAAVVAAAIWWWAGEIASPVSEGASKIQQAPSKARWAVSPSNPKFVLVIACLTVAFFTLPWSLLLIFLVPVAAVVVVTRLQAKGRAQEVRWAGPALRASALIVSFWMIGSVAMSPTVWLPVRAVDIDDEYRAELNETVVTGRVSAYVLASSDERTSLLLHEPRAVITIPTDKINPYSPLCVFPPSPRRWLFLRASQVLGVDPDFGSPYVRCPDAQDQ
jgi:hypothetical protein